MRSYIARNSDAGLHRQKQRGNQVNYPGGKNRDYQTIINLIPPHKTYIEPFVGSGAVLRKKRPARSSIAIDADAEAIDNLRYHLATNGDIDGIQLLNTDALAWLQNYPFSGDEFVYADPPYVLATRRQHRPLYRYELTDCQHEQLLQTLTALPCKIMISGYWSELYAQYLAGWATHTFDTRTRGGSWATEVLWMNYPTPVRLHDYQYLGDGFRERERIKRKANRWAAKFEALDMLERRAIMAQLEPYL